MLSDRLDPDQDLQSGPKLLHGMMHYKGGGRFHPGVLYPSCKIHWGGLCPSCKIHGGIMSMYTKMSRWDFVRWGGGGEYCPYPADKAHLCIVQYTFLWFRRFTCASSLTDMLQDLDWESLESRRVKIQLTLLFKVIQDLVDIPASAYFTPASTWTRANRTKSLGQISSRSDAYKFSFFPRAIPVWNCLPATVVKAPCLVSFRQGLFTLTF